MQINTDSSFHIGKTHKICEDYAISETDLTSNFYFAGVSDGCSSSKNTDFGSRILLTNIKNCIKKYNDNLSIEKIRDFLKVPYIKSLNVITDLFNNNSALDATLLISYIHYNKIIVISIGDGSFVARKIDGTQIVKTIEFQDNAPIYLNYLYDENRYKMLKSNFNCTKVIKTTTIDPNYQASATITKYISDKDIEIFEYDMNEYDMVTLLTDGVMSFTKESDSLTSKVFSPVSETAIISSLIDYKNFNGMFVQRRCNKFIKDCIDEKMIYNDDFSVATIIVKE